MLVRVYVLCALGWGMAIHLRGFSSSKGQSPRTDSPPQWSAHGQMRRAWRVLALSFACFVLLVASVGVSFTAYRAYATKPRSGLVRQIVTGTQAQVRSRQQAYWHDVIEGSVINEGDTIRTGDDTRMKATLFDNTIVELSANTAVSFDQLRASQYLDRNATITLQQDYGRLVVAATDDPTFTHIRVAVRTRGSTVEARQPGTKFRVLVLSSQADDLGRTDVSVLNGADVTVVGAGQQVTVANGQQTVIQVGSAPTAPTVKQRELIDNGDFKLGGNVRDQVPSHWLLEQDDGGDGAGTRASASIVPETIRGQPANALHFVRPGGNADSDLIGVRQTLTFSELDEFDSVVLSADVKVVSHSLSAGGERGSEYPLIFLVRYVDTKNDPVEKGQAFYVQNSDGYRTDNGIVQGTQIKPGVWSETIHWELKQVYPVPYKLVSIQVYASGHDYDAYVANISIVAK